MSKKCRYTVEPGRHIYLNGAPYIAITRVGETLPHHADALTHHVAKWLNRKGCFVAEVYPKQAQTWKGAGRLRAY